MKHHPRKQPGTLLLTATLALLLNTTAFAAPREELLAGYAAAAKSALTFASAACAQVAATGGRGGS